MRIAVLFAAALALSLPLSLQTSAAEAMVHCGSHAHYVKGHRAHDGHYIKGHCVRDHAHH